MGGMVAMEMMRLAPGRVKRLALVDTVARPDAWTRKVYRRLANLVVSASRDFRLLAERSLGSLIQPSTSAAVREAIVEMGVRVGSTV